MHYVIDGYNLLHHVGRLSPGRGNLEAARLDLLRLLQGRFTNSSDLVTVVFDARNAPATVKNRGDYHGIEVLFARTEEADDLIEALIRRTPTPPQLSVVSNDRRLKEAARRKRCLVVECVAFWESLVARPRAAKKPEPETPQPEAEADHWMKEFADLDTDKGFKEFFDSEMMKEDDPPEP